jgi:hypothetical protein
MYFSNKIKFLYSNIQDRQFSYNVTLRGVLTTIVVVEKK